MSQPPGPASPAPLDPLSQGQLRQLRFPAELEREFCRQHLDSVRPMIRLGLVVALFTTLGFTVIDHTALMGITPVTDYVRFGLQLPVIVVCLMATNLRFYRRWYETAVTVGAVLFGTGTVLMAVSAAPEHTPLVGSRLLLVTFFVYFLVGLRVREALLANACIALVLTLANLQGLFVPAVAAYQLFALACANIIGAAGAYALEYANRLAFLERKQLATVASHDGLTGLLNRHAFESGLRALWAQAMTRRQRVAVIMIDIDDFKAYNDLLGHQAGDDCLRQIAGAVRSAVGDGPGRFVARYGGEELVAVLGDSDEAGVVRTAQEIVAAVSRARIVHPGSDTAGYVTVSVGAASQTPTADESHDFAVKIADRALYTAKRQGRNRSICVRVPEPEIGQHGSIGTAGGRRS